MYLIDYSCFAGDRFHKAETSKYINSLLIPGLIRNGYSGEHGLSRAMSPLVWNMFN